MFCYILFTFFHQTFNDYFVSHAVQFILSKNRIIIQRSKIKIEKYFGFDNSLTRNEYATDEKIKLK